MLEGLEPKVQKRNCKVNTILQGLNEKDQKILLEAIANTQWTVSGLAKELTARGLAISEKPINAHRQGRCSC
jgi:hypothetical protein